MKFEKGSIVRLLDFEECRKEHLKAYRVPLRKAQYYNWVLYHGKKFSVAQINKREGWIKLIPLDKQAKDQNPLKDYPQYYELLAEETEIHRLSDLVIRLMERVTQLEERVEVLEKEKEPSWCEQRRRRDVQKRRFNLYN